MMCISLTVVETSPVGFLNCASRVSFVASAIEAEFCIISTGDQVSIEFEFIIPGK